MAKLEIFDVEHGACALYTDYSALGVSNMLIDCGHNSSAQWFPGNHLVSTGYPNVDVLVVTNFDEDHASGSNNLFDSSSVSVVYKNRSINRNIISNMKSDSGGMGPGIDRLTRELERFNNPCGFPYLKFPNLTNIHCFYNTYPEFSDENNLSLLFYFEFNGYGILFTGDL